MKTKFTFLVISVLLTIGVLAQQRTDYSTVFLEGGSSYARNNPSSTYWYGYTYVFNNSPAEESDFVVDKYELNSSNEVSWITSQTLVQDIPQDLKVTSCTFRNNLYAFYWVNESTTEIKYWEKKFDDDFHRFSIPVNKTILQQMAAVPMGDTLYLFFVDDADQYVKYYEIVYDSVLSHLELLSQEPVIVNQTYKSIGNVAAITYVDNELNERIMIAYPGETDARSDNKIVIYIGVPGHFEYYTQKPCYYDHHAARVSLAQGSVNGASTDSYMIQVGYTFYYDGEGLARCEIDVTHNSISDWEILTHSSNIIGQTTWFMELYSKATHSREKYLIQGYACGDGARGAFWKSDWLTYEDQIQESVPFEYASKFNNLVLVVEGAPPYTLNGYTYYDSEFDFNSLSEFDYVQGIENSVTASTTYSLGIGVNMGVGPVTAGFKTSFMQSSGTSNTTSESITEKIQPTRIAADSAGQMYYYYVTPTVVRSRWLMRDYDGNAIQPNRNLFFFQVTSPQLLSKTVLFDQFEDKSPRAYDLESYESRDVVNMSGISEILHKETNVDFSGSSAAIDVDFVSTHTVTNQKSYEVSLGIDAEYGIFSASAEATASIEYDRESTTTYQNGFHIEWGLFSPKYPEDTNNVQQFSPTVYIMRTTDSSAYFLDGLDGVFKDFKPFFVTYEVSDIVYGKFTDPPYSISEYTDLISKYSLIQYPNPCDDHTVFSYDLPQKSNVSLMVYDATGRSVGGSLNENQAVGSHEIEFSTRPLPGGLYFYRMMIDKDLITGKIIKR